MDCLILATVCSGRVKIALDVEVQELVFLTSNR